MPLIEWALVKKEIKNNFTITLTFSKEEKIQVHKSIIIT